MAAATPRRPTLALLLLALTTCLVLAHPAHARRSLKQGGPLNCSSIHQQCNSCSLRRVPSLPLPSLTSSSLVCKSCVSPVYQLFPANNTCGCAPGYYAQEGDAQANATCDACPKNSWCPGGLGASAQRTACGACLMTATSLAQSASACITQPGCGFNADKSAAPCSIGTYSTGSSQQPCLPCPAGLTTVSTFSRSVTECMAPPGYFYQNNQALPCPQGTYKVDTDKAPACLPCPSGLTTPTNSAASPAACSLAAPGYQPQLVDGVVVGVQPCPAGSYGLDGLQCIPCSDELSTESEASTSPADCLAPPGYGFYSDGMGESSPLIPAAELAGKKVVMCPQGSFKAGWNLGKCALCGRNLLTNTSSTQGLGLSADQCYVPPGWGSVVDASQEQLVASKCNNGTYGSSISTYGLEPHPCQPCPPHTATPDEHPEADRVPADIMTSPDSCRALPGYGWQPDGTAVPCPVGFFAPGFDNQACVKCGEGLTTASTASTTEADCVPLPGWQKKNQGDQFAVPCEVGSYSEGGAASVCHKCPLGSSTLYTQSSMASQCSVCAPGWGFSANTSQCAICAPGSFSPGGSDEPCVRCDAGQTSTLGATSSSDCLDEFISPAPYDFLPTPASAYVAVSTSAAPLDTATAASDCRAACAAEARCQYYLFRAAQADASQDGCFLKLAALLPAQDTYVSIKLVTGDYSIWQASADEYGLQASGAAPWASPDGLASDPWRCLRGCDKQASCRAVFTTKAASANTSSSPWVCWHIDGVFGLGTVMTGVKATSSQINAFFWGWQTDRLSEQQAAAGVISSPRPVAPPAASPQPSPAVATASPLPATEDESMPPSVEASNSSAANSNQAGLVWPDGRVDTSPAPANRSTGSPGGNASSPGPASGSPPAGAYAITTVAGYGDQASDGDGAPAQSAGLYYPYGVTVDKDDNVFICDTHNQRVRRVDAKTRIITTVAGTGGPGFSGDGGPATAAALNLPTSVAFDANGNMFITDTGNNRVRAVDAATGIITTVVGTGAAGWGGEGGPAAGVSLNVPVQVAFDSRSNMYVALFASQRVLRIDARTGIASTAAGIGSAGFSGDGGPATQAELNNPASVAFDPADHLFIADSLNQRVRRVDAVTGIITTVAGSRTFGFSGDGGPATAAQLWSPMSVAFDLEGNLLVSDTYNQCVRRVSRATGIIETISGTGAAGYAGDNGLAAGAQMSTPEGLAVDSSGSIYVADYANHRVRQLVRV